MNQPEGKRAAETQQRRRRRTDTSYENNGRLGVNESLLDKSKFTYRWVNDTNGRIEAFTKRDDWDIVTDPSIKEDGKNEGAQVRQLVGSKQDGSPLYAYLLQKPIEFHREDRAKKLAKLDRDDEAMKRGHVASPDALSANDPNAYIPSDGISMRAKAGRRAQESYIP